MELHFDSNGNVYFEKYLFENETKKKTFVKLNNI